MKPYFLQLFSDPLPKLVCYLSSYCGGILLWVTANRVFIGAIVLSSINIIILIPQKEDRPLVKLQIPKASYQSY